MAGTGTPQKPSRNAPVNLTRFTTRPESSTLNGLASTPRFQALVERMGLAL